MADWLALCVENFERDFTLWAFLKGVVNDCARRRIGTGRLMRVDLLGIMEADRGLRPVQSHVGSRDLIVDLAQWRQVVEHPEGAAVGRHNKVVILYHQVVNWRCRQIQLQRLPMPAVIERHVNTEFRSRIEQSAPLWVFAHRAYVGAVWDAVRDGS